MKNKRIDVSLTDGTAHIYRCTLKHLPDLQFCSSLTLETKERNVSFSCLVLSYLTPLLHASFSLSVTGSGCLASVMS